MPFFDGTGPFGHGPITGGGRGNCVVRVGDDRPAGFGRDCGRRGRGFNRLSGNGFRAGGMGYGAGSSQFSVLQAKLDRLAADVEMLRSKIVHD